LVSGWRPRPMIERPFNPRSEACSVVRVRLGRAIFHAGGRRCGDTGSLRRRSQARARLSRSRRRPGPSSVMSTEPLTDRPGRSPPSGLLPPWETDTRFHRARHPLERSILLAGHAFTLATVRPLQYNVSCMQQSLAIIERKNPTPGMSSSAESRPQGLQEKRGARHEKTERGDCHSFRPGE
jgi:hypothetical protein